MASQAAEVATRFKLSDPKPDRCAACFQGATADVRFVDLDSAIDRGVFVNEQGAVLEGIDDLHLCEACVKQAAEAIGFKPELHARQLREIRRLEVENAHWKDYAKRLEQTLDVRPESTSRKRGA